MRIDILCDMLKGYEHMARDGADIAVSTESEHRVEAHVREHGVRVVVDGVEQLDLNW